MTSNIQELGPCKRRLSITIPADDVTSAINKSYGELRKNVTIPGFRKGKTPRRVLEKRFGDHILEDVKKDLVVDGIQESIREHELEVVSDPDFEFAAIEMDGESDMQFDVDVEIRPEFELPSIDDIEVTRVLKEVGEDEVEKVIDNLRNERASWIPVEDEGAKEKDLVIGKLELKEGEEVAFERNQSHLVVGDDTKLAGIELPDMKKLFLGVTLDQIVTCEVEIPEDHPVKDLKGKTLAASFKVEEIKRMELPELNDEFAENFGLESLADLKGKVKEDVGKHIMDEANHKAEEDIIDAILERIPMELPESTVNRAVERQAQEVLMQRMMAGELQADNIVAAQADLKKELLPQAEKSIRAWYVIQKLAKREKIFSTETDYNERVEAMAMAKGVTPTAIREEIAKHDASEQVRTDILETKVRKWLTEQVKIVDETDGSSAA
ncbi:MAG: trigger factor [Planctomycetota bacterium]|jgi:trigger factor